MINDNVLSDILNNYKDKKDSQEKSIVTKKQSTTFKLLVDLFDAIWSLSSILLTSFILGFTLKLILGAHWNFFEYIIVGVAINTAMTYLHNLIHGLPQK